MTQGLQIFDPSGNLVIDIGDRVSRILGSVDTGGVAGSVTITVPPSNGIFTMTVLAGPVIDGAFVYHSPPLVTVSGSTISWTYPIITKNGMKLGANIVYGVW